VTDRGADLRLAFQQLADDAPADEVDAERVWRAVSGEADAKERRAVVERVAGDPSWALAWRAAHELWKASREDAAPAGVPARWPMRLAWGALAAALLGAVGTTLRPGPATRPTHRERAAVRIDSLLPEGRALPRADVVLRWTGAPGATYDVRLTSEDLLHVHTVTRLATSEYRPPVEFLSSLPAAATLLWQVEARLPGGSTVRSETFVTKID
jgi:hypothetical protein